MYPSGMRKVHAVQLTGLMLAFLVLLVASFIPNSFVQGADRPAALLQQDATGYWKFIDVNTRETFFEDWRPGSSWSPAFGDGSSGGTIIDMTGTDSVRVTTNCSWSVSGDTQVLYPGQTIQVVLMVDSMATGLTEAANLAGSDSLVASGFEMNFASAKDKYSVSSLNTDYGQGSGSGSLAIPAGSTGQHQTIEFACSVNAGMGTTYTDWNYEWVEGPTPTPGPLPPVQPSAGNKPVAGNQPGTGNQPPGGSTPPQASNALAGVLKTLGVAAGVIGTILLAAGTAAILVDRRNNAAEPAPMRPSPTQPQPEPLQISYLLKPSIKSLQVRPGEQIPVNFIAMRNSPYGEPLPAPEATIEVIVPESPAGLAVTPASGQSSLACIFSVPNPKVCTTLDVLAITSVGEQVKARVYVQVRILPLYELELKWEDPQQPPLQVDGKEVRAWARVNATPPDPDNSAESLADKVNVSVQGPNKDWIRQPLVPFIHDKKLWIPISVDRPAPAAELAPGNPRLEAQFLAGREFLGARLTLDLNPEVVLGAWVNGKKEADAIFQHGQDPPGWDFSEIVVYFHGLDNENKLVQPALPYGFDKLPIEAEPPILEMREFFEDESQPGRYIIRLALIAGIDLETCFGEIPVEQRRIRVKVFAKDEKGKEYRDYVTYRVRPEVTL